MYELLRPVMRAWYAKEMAASGGVPKPYDDALVTASGDDVDSVLLIGNGAAHGWGVTTHQLAITGHLSRILQIKTGRPCTVQYIGDETMNIASALAWVGNHDISRYDAIVIAVGMNDAVRLTTLPVWDKHLTDLLHTLQAGMKLSAEVLIAGIQPVRSVTPYNKTLGKVAEFHAGRMNHVTEDIATRTEDVTFFALPAPTLEPDRPHGSSSVYRSWARTIAEHTAPILDAVRAREGSKRTSTPAAARSFEWAGGAHLVEQAKTGGSKELQRLATLAQETFGVDVAAVTLLDGDRLWYAMNTHQLPMSIPRQVAYCNTVVEQNAPLFVPDAQKDDRYQGNPFIDVTGMNFYAGHPLHSTTGQTIGTFCLLNHQPRKPGSISPEALKMIALEAETELQRYELTGTTGPARDATLTHA
jgi:lysophospholipase L1-like esterase